MRSLRPGRALVLPLLLLNLGCGGPAQPSGSSSKADFLLVFTPVTGTYSAQFQGQTYTAAGSFEFKLAPGTYTVTGSFTGTALGIGFVALDGGVQSGSLKSLSGPAPDVESCSVIYFATGLQARTFQLQFMVTKNTGSVCQGG